ncbi:E3 ubiquitin-protein ligase TRIM47-like isoform X3 [Lethenteron reissneri]|uniref:E3 ubiquitin-protein ligase TRIM47-like isoform X3 n=1 Tax=Lethenteron reissneri TaxID=7753 RepID=UPI002AB615C5|nr:E3 ubiquitin-protein ligase TRIM47-like isoform X3 [Lethenteron reissneri]
MASATPSESVDSELRCSICLGTFVCPSTLSCGHSFCLRCLEAAWETAISFSCPQCRATFPVRPLLRKNVALANLAEQLRVGDGMATAVVCDICGDGHTPAVNTCLRCETSYCATHLKPHLENPRFKEHQLCRKLSFSKRHVKPHEDNPRLRDHAVVDPTASLDERRCPEHSEELKFYCTVDSSLVCLICTITGEHKGHDVTMLKKEHEIRKTRVGYETQAVEEKMKEAEKSVKRMEATHKEAQQSVAGIRGRITGKFACLRKALDEDEREALRRVAVKERELLSRIEEDIARHKRQIGELQAAAVRLRALEHENDSLAFLQGHLEETRSDVVQEDVELSRLADDWYQPCQDRPLWRSLLKDATGQLEAVALQQQRRAEERRSQQRAERRMAKAQREIPMESAPPPPTSLDATTIRSLERVVNRFLPLVCKEHTEPCSSFFGSDLTITTDSSMKWLITWIFIAAGKSSECKLILNVEGKTRGTRNKSTLPRGERRKL